MPNALASREAVQCDFELAGEKFFVVAKKQLTVGEQKALRKVFIRYTLEGKPLAKSTEMEEADTALILIALTPPYWNFTDPEGKELLLTAATIDALDPAVYEAIKEILNKLYTPMSEEEKNF
jgi:hypothetical protein